MKYVGGSPLAQIVRSEFAESFHSGSVAVLDARGTLVREIGDVTGAVFPRSSNKPMQTLAALRVGWKPQRQADLSIGSASHHGEPMHVDAARTILADAGLAEGSLLCPVDLPGNEEARRDVLAAGGKPERIYMNCSGKHSMMLATCANRDWPLDDYRDPAHPLQVAIRETVEECTGEKVQATGVDGCGAPVLAFSLTGLARAFQRFVEAPAGTHERAIADGIRAYPDLIGGTKSNDSRAMRAIGGLMSKAGAEGIQAFALPGVGAVAVKIDDGNGRAAMPVALAALRQLGYPEPTADAATTLAALEAPDIKGGGRTVGHLRVLI
ncbi:asparaginase [Natronoglycomyces albus]|uniref:Asparaginase n=2 Tax=Natronoglycomyces albus TaxID=2811108 RepID=A0A895XUR2_9ACTN|nr:asparaginase [Natronoglycomyces albus]